MKYSFLHCALVCPLFILSACGQLNTRLTLSPQPTPGNVETLPIESESPDVEWITVNKSIVTELMESGNSLYQLRSMGGTSSVGAFYGSGTGNKAFLGVGAQKISGKLVSTFQSLQFKTREDASNPVGSYNAYVNLIVDLNCNENNPDYAVIVIDDTAGGPKGSWNAYVFNASDSVFKSVGGKGGLPSHLNPAGAPLSTLTSGFPSACFVYADSFDNGMKRHQKLSPILFIHGDSSYSKASSVQLDEIQISIHSQVLTF